MTHGILSLGISLSTLDMLSFFTVSDTFFKNQIQLAHSQQQISIEIDPKDKHAWVSEGNALNRNGNYSKAITAYNKGP